MAGEEGEGERPSSRSSSGSIKSSSLRTSSRISAKSKATEAESGGKAVETGGKEKVMDDVKKEKEGNHHQKGKWISIGPASGSGEERGSSDVEGGKEAEGSGGSIGSRTRSKGQASASMDTAAEVDKHVKKATPMNTGQATATADNVRSPPTTQPSVTLSQHASQPKTPALSQPQPAAQSKSQPAAQPKSQPAAQPKSQPAAQPKSQPAAQPKSQPAAQLKSQPAAQPKSQPAAQPKSQPAAQPAAQPKSQPAAQPKSQPAAQPKSQPAAQPAAQPKSQPAAQPKSQPAAQPAAQPKSQPAAQPKSQPAAQPKSQPAAQPVAQPKSQPVARLKSQPKSQPVPQPAAQPKSQPVPQPAAQPKSQPAAEPVSSKRAQTLNARSNGRGEVRVEKDKPSPPSSSSAPAKKQPPFLESSLTFMSIKRELGSPNSDMDISPTGSDSEPKLIETAPSKQHLKQSSACRPFQVDPNPSLYGDGSGTSRQTPPLSQLYGEGSGTSRQTPPLSQLYGEGSGTSRQTPPLSQLYGEGSGTVQKTPPPLLGDGGGNTPQTPPLSQLYRDGHGPPQRTPPPSHLFGEGSGTARQTSPPSHEAPQLVSYPVIRGYSQQVNMPSAPADLHTHSQPGDGDASSRYDPASVTDFSDFQPERMGSRLLDRDVTPPADILEVTQQLAHGNYADWYQRFENDPHLLQQFQNYFNISTEPASRDELKGLTGSDTGSREERGLSREERGLSREERGLSREERGLSREERGLSVTSDQYQHRGNTPREEGEGPGSGPYQYRGEAAREARDSRELQGEAEFYRRGDGHPREYPSFRKVPRSAGYRPHDLPPRQSSRELESHRHHRVSAREAHSASPSYQGSRLPGGSAVSGAAGEEPLLSAISVGELKTILQQVRAPGSRATSRDLDDDGDDVSQGGYMGHHSEGRMADRDWEGDEFRHSRNRPARERERGMSGHHLEGNRYDRHRDEGAARRGWSRNEQLFVPRGGGPGPLSTRPIGRDSYTRSAGSSQREEYGPSLPPDTMLGQAREKEGYRYTSQEGWGRGEGGRPVRGRGLGNVGGGGAEMQLGGRSSEEWSEGEGEGRHFGGVRRGGGGWLRAGTSGVRGGERGDSTRQLQLEVGRREEGWSGEERQGNMARRGGDGGWESEGRWGEGEQAGRKGDQYDGGERRRGKRESLGRRRSSHEEWLGEEGGMVGGREGSRAWQRQGEEEHTMVPRRKGQLVADEGRQEEGWPGDGRRRGVDRPLSSRGDRGVDRPLSRGDGGVDRPLSRRDGGVDSPLSRGDGGVNRQGDGGHEEWPGERELDCQWGGSEESWLGGMRGGSGGSGGAKRPMARDRDGVLVGVRDVEGWEGASDGEEAGRSEGWPGGTGTGNESGQGLCDRGVFGRDVERQEGPVERQEGPAEMEVDDTTGGEGEGADGDRDTEDELYQTVETEADKGSVATTTGAASGAVDAAVQTGTPGEGEEEKEEASPAPQRKLLKKHATFSEAALREFTRRSRALITSVQELMR